MVSLLSSEAVKLHLPSGLFLLNVKEKLGTSRLGILCLLLSFSDSLLVDLSVLLRLGLVVGRLLITFVLQFLQLGLESLFAFLGLYKLEFNLLLIHFRFSLDDQRLLLKLPVLLFNSLALRLEVGLQSLVVLDHLFALGSELGLKHLGQLIVLLLLLLLGIASLL